MQSTINHIWLASVASTGFLSAETAVLRTCPYLGEQMVHDVSANVVMDLVEDAIVTVKGGQPSTQVGPLLTTVPGQLLCGVIGPVVVQVGHDIKPDLWP